MIGWFELALAFAVFFLSHMFPVRPPLKPWLVDHLGPRGFTLAYSIASLLILAWLISAAARAPFVPLWDFAIWQKHVTLSMMLLACVLVALAAGRPNPFSFGGPDAGFDPRRPGLIKYVRHPLLLALLFWALAHLVPNGDLAHVLLFGTFAGLAALGPSIVSRRRKREMGADWARLNTELRAAPIWPRPASWGRTLFRLGLGLAVYLVLIFLHPWLFGVSPLP